MKQTVTVPELCKALGLPETTARRLIRGFEAFFPVATTGRPVMRLGGQDTIWKKSYAKELKASAGGSDTSSPADHSDGQAPSDHLRNRDGWILGHLAEFFNTLLRGSLKTSRGIHEDNKAPL